MPIFSFSITYRDVPTEMLDTAAASPEFATSLLEFGAREAVSLCTCNRIESYVVADDAEPILDIIARKTSASAASFRVRRDLDAVRHIFRVAASLESMIVGETQIIAQLRRAEDFAVENSTIGPVLRTLFVQARRAGRVVRRRVEIGRGSLSMASLAREVARKIFRDLRGREVLVIGAGEIGLLAGRYFAESGVRLSFATRKASDEIIAFAESTGGCWIEPAKLEDALLQAEVVVTATSTRDRLITPQMLAGKRSSPQLLVDLSLPRNIDPACGEIPGTYLYAIPDLEEIAVMHREKRRDLISAAERIIDDRMKVWHRTSARIESYAELRMLQTRRAEWERSLVANPTGEEGRRAVRRIRRLTHKLSEALLTEEPLKRALNREMVRGLFHGD